MEVANEPRSFGAVSTQPPHLQLNRSAFATTRLRSSLVNSLKRLASVLTRCLKKLPLQVRPVAPRWVSDPKIAQRSCCEFLRNSAVPWSTFKCFNPGPVLSTRTGSATGPSTLPRRQRSVAGKMRACQRLRYDVYGKGSKYLSTNESEHKTMTAAVLTEPTCKIILYTYRQRCAAGCAAS